MAAGAARTGRPASARSTSPPPSSPSSSSTTTSCPSTRSNSATPPARSASCELGVSVGSLSLAGLAEDIAVEPGQVPAQLGLAVAVLRQAVRLAGVDEQLR